MTTRRPEPDRIEPDPLFAYRMTGVALLWLARLAFVALVLLALAVAAGYVDWRVNCLLYPGLDCR